MTGEFSLTGVRSHCLAVALSVVASLSAGATANAGFVTYFADANSDLKIDHDLAPGNGAGDTGRATAASSVTGYNAFIGALGPNVDIGIEDFEWKSRDGFLGDDPFLQAGVQTDLELRFDRLSPQTGSLPIDATLSGIGRLSKVPDPENRSGRYPVAFPVGGDQYFDTNFEQLAFTVDFVQPVQALGFFATDLGDFTGQVQLKVTTAAGEELINVPHQQLPIDGIANGLNATLIFFGFKTDSPFTKVEFSNVSSEGGYDRYGFDNLVVLRASEVPAPSSLVLAICGLLSAIGIFRFARRPLAAVLPVRVS